jgi:hypothetical protein
LPKEKLNLSIDEAVVRRAKDLGINISEITESFLRGYAASDKDEADTLKIRAGYQSLFKVILPTMERFDAQVEVGADFDDAGDEIESLFLRPDGSFYWWNNLSDQSTEANLDQVKLWKLHNPDKIVSNWLLKLKEAKQQNVERLRTLQLYQGIAEAMAKTLSQSQKTFELNPSKQKLTRRHEKE